MICKYFLLFCDHLFIYSVLWGTKVFNVYEAVNLFFLLLLVLLVSCLRIHHQIWGHEDLLPLTVLFVINFCIWCEMRVQLPFLYVDIQLPHPLILKRLSFHPLNCPGVLALTCMDLFLDSWFNSIDFYLYPYARITLFYYFPVFYWRIAALQCCTGFYHVAKWISHTHVITVAS